MIVLYSVGDTAMTAAIFGFSHDDLKAIADGLAAYERTVNVGSVEVEGDTLLESTTAAAERFIRTALASALEGQQDQPAQEPVPIGTKLYASPQPAPQENKQVPVHAHRIFQGGLRNEELIAAFKSKLTNVEPSHRDLSVFALGIEVGFDLAPPQPASLENVADAEIKAAYVASQGSDEGWLGRDGSYFIGGYVEGKRARPLPQTPDAPTAPVADTQPQEKGCWACNGTGIITTSGHDEPCQGCAGQVYLDASPAEPSMSMFASKEDYDEYLKRNKP